MDILSTNNNEYNQDFFIDEDIKYINENKKNINENKNKVQAYTFDISFVRKRCKIEYIDALYKITNIINLPIVLYNLIFDYYGIPIKFHITVQNNYSVPNLQFPYNRCSKIVSTCKIYSEKDNSGFRLNLFTIEFYDNYNFSHTIYHTTHSYKDVKKIIYSFIKY
jgi:hypothetical protein